MRLPTGYLPAVEYLGMKVITTSGATNKNIRHVRSPGDTYLEYALEEILSEVPL